MHKVWGLGLVLGCASVPHRAEAPLTLTHLGVAGWSISDGKHTVLVDPYFSRPADWKHAHVDEAAVAAHAPAHADVVVVGHAHVDHALDAPLVARRAGAVLVGSEPLRAPAREVGLEDARIVTVQGGEDLAFDGFSVRVIPSLHSMIGFENGGDVKTFAYLVRMAGQEVLVFDTANFIERELTGLHPDVLIAAPGLREQVHDYSCRLMVQTGKPRLVLATHFDAWRAPLRTPLDSETQADLRAFAAEIHRCAPRSEVVVPTPGVPIRTPRGS